MTNHSVTIIITVKKSEYQFAFPEKLKQSKSNVAQAAKKGRSAMAIVTVTKENFEKEVLQAEKPVMVDFWATWCGPCRMLSPIVDQLAEERADAVFGKVNVDEQQELAAQFGIMSIPTVVVFKNGKVVRQTVGAQPKAALEKMLESI